MSGIGFFIWFVIITLLIEFIAMFMTVDDFGENIFTSIILSVIITVLISLGTSLTVLISLGTSLIDVQVETQVNIEQKEMIDEQWPVNSDELNKEDIKRLEEELYEPDEPAEEVVATTTPAIPTNTQHINNNRRNYRQEVEYNSTAKQACYHLGCFNARLVQHSDGTFWACRRNYGTCYQYITKGD